MGRIPQHFIDDLLARVDLVEFIHRRLPLKKAGKNYQACCPFHDEKTPSFSVNPQKQFYYCFGCGAGGNAIGFAMDYGNISFPEAVEQIAAEFGMEVPKEAGSSRDEGVRPALLEVLAAADRFYRNHLKQHQAAIDYLKARGLSGSIARDYAIGAAPPGWDSLISALGADGEKLKLMESAGLVIHNDQRNSFYDRFRDRVIFPIRDTRGRTIGFGGRVIPQTASDGGNQPKYLNSPETPVFHKGQELYGLYEIMQQREKPEFAIVVEGYMDVVALAQYGLRNAVATLGTAVGPAHLDKLFRYVADVVFCFDGDEAGTRAAERALHAALPMMIDGRQVRFLFLPQGEDPDTMVRKEGLDKFRQRIATAMPLSSFMLKLAGLDGDLPTPDAKSVAYSRAGPLLAPLPKGAFRKLMEGEVHRLTGVEPGQAPPAASPDLAIRASALRNANPKSKRDLPGGQSFAAHLIGILLQYPALATKVPALENQGEDADTALLVALSQYLVDRPQAAIGAILGYWMAQDRNAARRLIELASRRLLDNLDAASASLEFETTLQRWQASTSVAQLQARLQALDQKAHEELTPEDKQLKRQLLAQLSEFRK